MSCDPTNCQYPLMKGFAHAYMIVFPGIHMDHSAVQKDKYTAQKKMSMVLQEREIGNGIGIEFGVWLFT